MTPHAMARLSVLAVSLVCTPAHAQQNVTFPTSTFPGVSAAVDLRAAIYRPRGDGPFPAVIVMHGCGGVGEHQSDWAKRLASWGYVAVALDSFGPRGHGNICQKTSLVPPDLRVFDIIGAAEYLAQQPYAAKGQIALLGFSHGGWTMMKAVQEHQGLAKYGIKGAVAYYPYCTPGTDRFVALPLLILIGQQDDWTPESRCLALIAQGLKRHDLVELVGYSGAYHSFDFPASRREVWGIGSDGKVTLRRLEFNREATRDAEARTKAFFERLFANPG